MNYDRDRMNDGQRMSIAPGETVYDVNGDKIGSVQEYNPQANCLVVEKGFFFPKEVYIPASAISGSNADGISVNLTKDDLKDDRYASPPTTGTTGDMNDNTRVTQATGAYDQTANADQLSGMQGHQTPPREGDIAVPVREEELVAEKQRGEIGRAHIHKDTVEEQQALNVPVQHEEVTVERVPVDKDLPADQANAADWQDKDVVMPVMGEEVVTEKRPHVTEEIHLHKRNVTENQQVGDTVRKERVEVEGVDDQGNLLDRSANENMNQNTDRNP